MAGIAALRNSTSRSSRSLSFNRFEDVFYAHNHRRPLAGELESILSRIRARFQLSLVPAAHIAAVDEATGSTIWLVEDDGAAEGVNLWAPLSAAGALAIRERRFSPETIEPSHLAPAGSRFAAVYHWGYCGFTREARRSIMRLCAELLEGPLSTLDVYGRVVTAEGAAAAARLGIEPCFELGENFYVHRAKASDPQLGEAP